LLGPAWTVIDDDCFGEFAIMQMLSGKTNATAADASLDYPADARNAAAGWNGDHYRVWANGSGIAIVWRSSWDSVDDAIEFEQALATYDAGRRAVAAQHVSTGMVVSGERRMSRIARNGHEVTYVLVSTAE
jgi:hypothetical protein